MTTTTATRFRPDSSVIMDGAWRACLGALATAGVLLGVPVWARATLSIAAAVVTVLFVLRRSERRGILDSVLAAIAVIVAVLALLGLLLDVLPSGISAASWGIGVGVIELATLIALGLWRAPKVVTRSWIFRLPLRAIAWTVVVCGVLATALVWSTSSYNSAHIAPLAMGLSTSGDSSVITVSSGSDDGPYDLRVVSSTGRALIAKNVRVSPGHPAAITIDLPENTREKVQLISADGSKTLRELILDNTTDTTKVTR
jgi:hypothetical protein